MNTSQPGILAPENKLARFLTFSLSDSLDLPKQLNIFVDSIDVGNTVIGLGQSLVSALEKEITELKTFPDFPTSSIKIPSTSGALWCWLRGTDRGEIFHRSRNIETLLSSNFRLDEIVDCFQFDENRDLTGYIDGTENPEGKEAIDTAIVQDIGPEMDGSSFVAVQKWQHDLDCFNSLTSEEQDNSIGRRRSDNEELDDAPESAHVKRTAQESFDPEAFILRRSMPWADGMRGGLNFVAFGKSFNAFEALLNRMLGNEDQIRDALFDFSRPLSGAYYWCPPIRNGRLNLTALDL